MLYDLVEPAEDVLLDLHRFIDRFDHQIAVGEIVEVQRRGQPAHRRSGIGRIDPAALDAGFIVLPHHTDAAIERGLFLLDDRHRDSGRKEVHGDPAAHGAGADHPDLGDRDQRRIGRQVVNLRAQLERGLDMRLRAGKGIGHR